MSSHFTLQKSKFSIPRGAEKKALDALKKHGRELTHAVAAGQGLAAADTLDAALAACDWHATRDKDGVIGALKPGVGKVGTEDRLFEVLGPFVAAGSFLQLCGEGKPWRYAFDGENCQRQLRFTEGGKSAWLDPDDEDAVMAWESGERDGDEDEDEDEDDDDDDDEDEDDEDEDDDD